MLHSIGNECLTLKVDSLGAQMTELSSCCENQFLWDGDPAYWNGRAPCLFPYVGRLTDNTYMLHGKKYSMGIHGFAWTSEFAVDEQREDFIRYRLSGNSDTGKQYPFDFDFYIQYNRNGWKYRTAFLWGVESGYYCSHENDVGRAWAQANQGKCNSTGRNKDSYDRSSG